MNRLKSTIKIGTLGASLSGLILLLLFQNCSDGAFKSNFTTEMNSSSLSTPPANSEPQLKLYGKALYDSQCMKCHSAFEISNLKGRTITSETIKTAYTSKISAMKFLDGTLNESQLTSLESIFLTTVDPTTPSKMSSFTCASADDEKKSSARLLRLMGPELRNTYSRLLPTTVWSGLASKYYLIPPDQLDGQISNFNGDYTQDFAEQISRFNEEVALLITATSASTSAFFGSCTTTNSFPKSCFDSFFTSKVSVILRSAVPQSENAAMWAVISQAPSAIEQMKTAIQLLFNDPRFLYHLELLESAPDAQGNYLLSSYAIANRLAYGLTAAPPDSLLWDDAVAGRLTDLGVVRSHINRISQGQVFKNRSIELIKFFVGVQNSGLAPTQPEFLNGLSATNLDRDATEDFNQFINYIVFTQNGTLADLFSSKVAFPKSNNLAQIYNTTVWSTGVPRQAENHPGILTKPFMNLVSNPNLKLVQRGKKIRINMLCSDVPQPSLTDLAGRPAMTEADLINLNRRQFINKATMGAASCIVCHSKMNELGFATEAYDSAGRYSPVEKIFNNNDVKVAEHPVVLASTPKITENDSRTFANVSEFQMALAESDPLQQCLTRKTYQFLERKEENFALDSCRLQKMDNLLKSNQPLINFLTENFKQPSVLYKRGN